MRFNQTDKIILLIFAIVLLLIALSVARFNYIDCRAIEQNITICKDVQKWKWEPEAKFFSW